MVFPSTRSESYTVDNHRNPLFTEISGTDVARNGHNQTTENHNGDRKITDQDYELTSVVESAVKWLWIVVGIIVIIVPLIAYLLGK